MGVPITENRIIVKLAAKVGLLDLSLNVERVQILLTYFFLTCLDVVFLYLREFKMQKVLNTLITRGEVGGAETGSNYKRWPCCIPCLFADCPLILKLLMFQCCFTTSSSLLQPQDWKSFWISQRWWAIVILRGGKKEKFTAFSSITSNLGKYLGFPLLTKRPGRVTLAKSLLFAIPAYNVQTMWFPDNVCDTIEY